MQFQSVYQCSFYYAPAHVVEGALLMGSGVYLSVRPSVWLSVVCLDLIRERKGLKPRIGRMEAHHTSNLGTYLKVKRSKVKVTRPTNAHTVNAQYFSNGQDTKIKLGTQTEHTKTYIIRQAL